jgi:pimeloyl-ACP methyl ester carboxylesterase
MPEVKSHPCFLTPSRLNPDYPLFVFLPGMDGTGQLLRTQTEGLEAAFDIRCLAIPADDLTSWEILTDQVVALIEAELEKQPHRSVYLCGESFGGCLAIKVALRSPHLFDRLILVNPASSFNQRAWLNWGSLVSGWLPEVLYRIGSVWLLPFLAALERMTKSDARALLEAMQSVPPKTVIWRLSLIREFHVDPTELLKILQPALLIAGDADQLLPSVAEIKRLAAWLPYSQTVVLPRSGHACLLEADINLYKILKDQNFLERRDQALIDSTPELVATPA